MCKRQPNKIRALQIIAGAALVLSACQKPPELGVEAQWADTMRRLNMFGFYPMSEDVQVGDVYLHVPPDDGSASQPRFSLVRVATTHPDAIWNELVQQQSDRRLRLEPLPATKPAETSGAPANAVVREGNCTQQTLVETMRPVAAHQNGLPQTVGHADHEGCDVRLQRAAIPGLTVGRLTNAQIGVAGAYGNVGARLGIGSNSQVAISIALRNLQEMSLDAWRISRILNGSVALDILGHARAEDLLFYLGQLDPSLMADACNGRADRLAARKVEIVVVNRVMYAGGIEYNFTRNAETALRAALDLQSILPNQPQAPQIPTLAGTDGKPVAIGLTPAPNSADAAKASAERLSGLLQAVTGETGQGGARAGISTSFGIGTFGNLSLKQDFNRPIAVGMGARVSFPFYQVLAGIISVEPKHTDGVQPQERFDYASAFCRSRLSDFKPNALHAAMGLQ